MEEIEGIIASGIGDEIKHQWQLEHRQQLKYRPPSKHRHQFKLQQNIEHEGRLTHHGDGMLCEFRMIHKLKSHYGSNHGKLV